MAILHITRSSEYANRIRKIGLYIDGNKSGEIGNGETKTFELSPGTHTLQAKIDWCTSNLLSITCHANENKYVSLCSFAKKSRFGIFASIYYITLGSKKYLHLQEETSLAP